MDPLCAFFLEHLVEIYFVYGLAFFVAGIVVWMERGCSRAFPTAYALPFLAAFGMIHGSHEWFEMFLLIFAQPTGPLIGGLRIALLAVSFILLIEFGLRSLAFDSWPGWERLRWPLWAIFGAGLLVMGIVWQDVETWLAAADAWCRYSLAIPGAVVTAAGLFKQSRHPAHRKTRTSRALQVVAVAFLVYGFPGQFFVGGSRLPPSTVLNSALFLDVFHFPIQLLRTLMASIVAVFMARASRTFELERQQEVQELTQARIEAQQQLNREIAEREALQRSLLRQVVWAQEEERKHIARELHDEAGQALTALSWQLAAVEEALPADIETAHERLAEVRQLTDQVMQDLRQLTTDLRPAVLDELGLVPALITYADECSSRLPLTIDVEVTGRRRRLPPEIEVALYRITQEGLTNVIRHAEATHATLQLHLGEQEVSLHIVDNGVGMDVAAPQQALADGSGWGLAGIQERVELFAGELEIHSTPGVGTELIACIPIPEEMAAEEEEVR